MPKSEFFIIRHSLSRFPGCQLSSSVTDLTTANMDRTKTATDKVIMYQWPPIFELLTAMLSWTVLKGLGVAAAFLKVWPRLLKVWPRSSSARVFASSTVAILTHLKILVGRRNSDVNGWITIIVILILFGFRDSHIYIYYVYHDHHYHHPKFIVPVPFSARNQQQLSESEWLRPSYFIGAKAVKT